MNEANTIGDAVKRAESAIDPNRMMARGSERLVQMKDRVWDRSKTWAKGMDTCVHEHTWMALGMTVALGIIFGLAVGRR